MPPADPTPKEMPKKSKTVDPLPASTLPSVTAPAAVAEKAKSWGARLQERTADSSATEIQRMERGRSTRKLLATQAKKA